MSSILSEHFSWEEACITSHREISNDIPISLIEVIRNTASGMERIRALLSSSITINSWYRSPLLNAVVGSAKTSQHLKGEAVDFIAPKYGTPLQIVQRLSRFASLINFDQLIYEYSWVHVSFVAPTIIPRKQVLTLLESKKYAIGITDRFGKNYES